MAMTVNLKGFPVLPALRRECAARKIAAYKAGNQWISSKWSPHYGAWMEIPLHYRWDGASERQVLLHLLGYEIPQG